MTDVNDIIYREGRLYIILRKNRYFQCPLCYNEVYKDSEHLIGGRTCPVCFGRKNVIFAETRYARISRVTNLETGQRVGYRIYLKQESRIRPGDTVVDVEWDGYFPRFIKSMFTIDDIDNTEVMHRGYNAIFITAYVTETSHPHIAASGNNPDYNEPRTILAQLQTPNGFRIIDRHQTNVI